MGIRLIVTDLDGTLIGRASEEGLYESFRDVIDDMRRSDGVFWAVSTGRSLRSFKRYFTPLASMGLVPDYVIVKHAYIYGSSHSGYSPHRLWNFRTRVLILKDRIRLRRTIKRWHRTVVRRFIRVRTLVLLKNRLTVRFDTAECASTAAEMLRSDVNTCRHLQVFRHAREVDVIPVPFTKGLALSELAVHLGVDLSETLAVGDGHNDISMLNGSTAGLTGCPANAEPEVIEIVHKSEGHVASKRALAGVLEVILAHRTGRLRSGLPKWWHDPSRRGNRNKHAGRGRSRSRKRRLLHLMLLLAIGYATLMVFASFGLIPLSDVLMKPYRILGGVIERLLDWFYR